jgi:hypothetical protein
MRVSEEEIGNENSSGGEEDISTLRTRFRIHPWPPGFGGVLLDPKV